MVDNCSTVEKLSELFEKLTEAQQKDKTILAWFSMRKIQVNKKPEKTNNEKASELFEPGMTENEYVKTFIAEAEKIDNKKDLAIFYKAHQPKINELRTENYDLIAKKIDGLNNQFA